MSEKKLRRLFRAEWREIVVVNFEIDPKILEPYTPPKTEIDFFNDVTFVSLIARNVKRVKPGNYPIYFSRPFEQIQLRFYVKRQVGDTVRNGVAIIKDYLPRRRISLTMNKLFKHSFVQVPMQRESSNFDSANTNDLPSVEYRWLVGEHWNHIRVKARSQMRPQRAQTKESFVLDHHWGYTLVGGKTFEYYVEYPAWAMWDAQSGAFDCDTEQVFGRKFVKTLRQRPASVFLARGSEITIYHPSQI